MAKITELVDNLNEYSYMFPKILISIYSYKKEELYFCCLGELELPIGSFVYRIRENDGLNKTKIELLYMKLNSVFAEAYIYAEIIEYLVSKKRRECAEVIVCIEVSEKEECSEAFSKFRSYNEWLITHERFDVRLYPKSNLRHWNYLANIFKRNHKLSTRKEKNQIYRFSELNNISLAQLENTQTPEWADPFNSGLFSPRLSEHSYVFFEGERPRAWIIGSVVCNEALLIETMWSDFKGSYDLVYALLYIQFIGIWGHEMTNWLIESCIFCFQQKNAGMTRLLERMNSFKLEVNKTIQLEKSIKFKEYGE
tara:strand:+ start:1345 stop:2274 length:930 start_codon:yes stop_codon:yes gene_type:complete